MSWTENEGYGIRYFTTSCQILTCVMMRWHVLVVLVDTIDELGENEGCEMQGKGCIYTWVARDCLITLQVCIYMDTLEFGHIIAIGRGTDTILLFLQIP